jgi:5-methyltetrahydropteroyltriglutamate--homocysteine methyltransferase
MKTTVVGAYPKISDEHQDLRRALHRLDRDELDEAGIQSVYDETTAWAMDDMRGAGIDIINDGQIRWDDLLAPFARAWRNTERGPLERFYDNNTYFRQPIITGPIETDGKTLVRDFTFAAGHLRTGAPSRAADGPILKAAIAGPLTFATLTAEDAHYKDLEARTLAVADALAAELRGLKAAGATLVDIEEPALAAHPELIDLESAALERLAKAGVPLALYPYFFPSTDLVDALARLPVAQVGIDVRSRESSADAIHRLGAIKQIVVLGVIDARNTRVETGRETAALVEAALKQLRDEKRLYLSTTTGLEYLPHDVAVKKLKALADAARATKGVPA